MKWFLGNIIFWLFYRPLLIVLKTLLFFIPKVQERVSFEKKNILEPGAKSFNSYNLKADLCFEFSSEGEYQQVASLIDDALESGKKIELIFFSPSVEKTIIDLYHKFPRQIRYLRYPLLDPKLNSWISSSTLIMVRYDLFPELLLWSLKKGRKLKFVWVTFKKERVKKKLVPFIKLLFLSRSDFTIFASEQDYELGKSMGINGTIYDFRMEQIKRRLLARDEKFFKMFPLYSELKLQIAKFPREKRLIFGNAWPEDLFLLKNLPSDVFLLIVPHKLTPEILEKFRTGLVSLGHEPQLVSDTTVTTPLSSLILLNKKGVLCELYSDFGKAYVGGGFGESVHSLLEPLVAGCEHLSCGPVNHRSTEFDLAGVYGQLKEIKTNQEFLLWLQEDISGFKVHDRLKTQIDSYPIFQKEILSC